MCVTYHLKITTPLCWGVLELFVEKLDIIVVALYLEHSLLF